MHAHLEDIVVPLLIMHGGADPATNIEGSRDLSARARSTDKTLKIYDGVAHDLMHEPERDAIIGDVAAWLDARAAPR
jgi:acylglycerol lipase